MAETYQIETNLEQLERLLKNLPEGIMLEICFGKVEHGEDTLNRCGKYTPGGRTSSIQ